jgi:hypothetical protein
MKEVDIDLYDFLKNNETGLYICNNELVVYICIDFRDVQTFINIIGANFFSEGGFDCKIHDGYISIELNEIIEEWYGQNLSSYKNCFGVDDWEEYENDILRKEKTVEEFCEEFLREE